MEIKPALQQEAAAPEQKAADVDVVQSSAGAPEAEPAKQHAGAEAKPAHNPEPTNPNKKRKVALFLAYVGHGYQGMQRNPGAKTIEDELFKALHAAGAISGANADEHGFTKLHWMRSARTDKGVSAVGQVVSLKMVLEPPGVLQRINAALPDQIRVFGYSRATNGFDSRKHCDKRRYEYILPEWAFDPGQGQGRVQRAIAAANGQDGQQSSQQDGQQQQVQAQAQAPAAEGGQAAESGANPQGELISAHNGSVPDEPMEDADGAAGGSQAHQSTGDDAQAADAAQGAEAQAGGRAAADGTSQAAAAPPASVPAARDGPFVFDDSCVQRLTSILSKYEGSHNFHNYTVRKPASAPDVKRYILSFRCHGTFEIDGQRWVRMVVIGQSFMLHQIRKMVGMAVAVMRGAAPENCLSMALKTSADLNTPMAPELGLFLDECYFDAYNAHWGELHGQLRLSDWQAEADAFKVERLYPHIAARDAADGVNAAWVKTLNEANYRFGEWEEQISRIRQGGGRRLAPAKGEGAAAVVGAMESYGAKRPHGSGGRGDRGKRQRGDASFGGRTGRVLPPPHLRKPKGGGAGADQFAAAELSD